MRCSSFPNRTRFAGLRFGLGRNLERKSILPTYCTSEQAAYRLLRLFQKSERAHCAAPPFQIGPASLGFDLVLGVISKEDRSYPLIARRSKVRFAPAIFFRDSPPLLPPFRSGPVGPGSELVEGRAWTRRGPDRLLQKRLGPSRSQAFSFADPLRTPGPCRSGALFDIGGWGRLTSSAWQRSGPPLFSGLRA